MKNFVILSIYLGSLLLFVACAGPENATIEAQKAAEQEAPPVIPKYDSVPDQKFAWITLDGGQSQLDFNPQVDILFVSDNSDSMKSTQANLSRNIEKFANGITQNKMIDYHIGVVSTWDSSERFAKNKKDKFEMGDLRYVTDRSGKVVNLRYVTKATRSKIDLASTINIGVAPYDQGGPEVEEFFTPLEAALQKNGRDASNEEFFRAEAQLVVILVTDADDSTARISPEQMAQILVDSKGGQAKKVSAYGVLVRANDSDDVKDWALKVHPTYHPECFDMSGKKPKSTGQCKGFGPDRIEQFIIAANADAGTPDQIRAKFIMPLTSKKFGDDLAKIGGDITVKTLAKEIFLQQRPRLDEATKKIMIRVRYGIPSELAKGKGQLIPQQQAGGWLYNPENNSIRLSGDVKYVYVEGARFAIDMMTLVK